MYDPKPNREGGFVFTFAAKSAPESYRGNIVLQMNTLRSESWFIIHKFLFYYLKNF